MEREPRPDCHRCAAFFVTYEPEHPYGCRTFGMKSRLLPSTAVRTSSGEECQAFEPKHGSPGAPGLPRKVGSGQKASKRRERAHLRRRRPESAARRRAGC